MAKNDKVKSNAEPKEIAIRRKRPRWLPYVVAMGLAVVLFGVRYAIAYSSTPEHVRRPQTEHAHVRLQVVANGQPVDFSKPPYQHPQAATDSCSDEIETEPFHFHDNLDQMLHLHWQDMTGGELLKYYGWNVVGGANDDLGYRYDGGLLKPQKVPVHGQNLPSPTPSTQYFVYIGDADSYQKKDWHDFLKQDFETFLGRESRLPASQKTSWLGELLAGTVQAHGAIEDDHNVVGGTVDLERVQNLLGNIVIFSQEKEPTNAEVMARFETLIPLPESSCSG
jgi:hypothetical protein